jgi:hypothetical protein
MNYNLGMSKMKKAKLALLSWVVAFISYGGLSAGEIPREKGINSFSLKRGIEVWLRPHVVAPSIVACRFVGHDPLHGKPQIFDLDCPSHIFESELPVFLEYCEEEIQKQGWLPIGLIAVGCVDGEGIKDYLAKRYKEKAPHYEKTYENIQLFSKAGSENMDVCLSYPMQLSPIETEEDLKKLWVFYLIQSMAEERLKQAAAEVDGWWVSSRGARHLLPALATVGHALEKADGSYPSSKLLVHFLEAIQILKEQGFTEGELAACKSKLQRHLHRFYQTPPTPFMLADYYASHLAAALPCSDYSNFMQFSLDLVANIEMSDISEMLNVSFLDETRAVTISFPEEFPLTRAVVQETLNAHPSDSLVFTPQEPEKPAILDEKDPFAQLPITEEEEKMMQDIIQTVAKTNPVKLGFMRAELERKRLQLIHIHPLRSLATFVQDPTTKQCLAEILDSFFKGSSFVSDFSKRMKQESEKDNLLIYVPGFCQTVKANADQVHFYINTKEYEKLIKYLLKLDNE